MSSMSNMTRLIRENSRGGKTSFRYKIKMIIEYLKMLNLPPTIRKAA